MRLLADPAEARRLWTEARDLYARIGMTLKVKHLQDLLDGAAGGSVNNAATTSVSPRSAGANPAKGRG